MWGRGAKGEKPGGKLGNGGLGMVVRIRGKVLLAVACTAALGLMCGRMASLRASGAAMAAGGRLHAPPEPPFVAAAASLRGDRPWEERFRRPSAEPPYPNPYSFEDFQKAEESTCSAAKVFDNPRDLILAYYGILGEASNMLGYSGGCGTVGQALQPYPCAYGLLSEEKRAGLSLDQFIASFGGIGHITLLKLLPAYTPAGAPRDVQTYMVELEVITGAPQDAQKARGQGTAFVYYYGLVTVGKAPGGGWEIRETDYIAEDFLCAPTHGWFYLSDAVVQIVYGDNLKLIDRIDGIRQTGSRIRIQASGRGGCYGFEFVRLTNGYDILLHEYVLDGGVWKEADLLTDQWGDIKLTAQNSALQNSAPPP